jgi:hypothetical protein
MSVRVARESDGRVSIELPSAEAGVIKLSPVEARLIAIKLLLAAEDVTN